MKKKKYEENKNKKNENVYYILTKILRISTGTRERNSKNVFTRVLFFLSSNFS